MNTLVLPLGLLVFLAVMLFIGFLAADEIKVNSANFLVAGRRMPLYLAASTLMAQSVDSNATLGNTDEIVIETAAKSL